MMISNRPYMRNKIVRTSMLIQAVFLFTVSISIACDTNLVSLFIGEKSSDVFSRMVYKLVSETKDVGQSASNPNEAAANLKILMKSWMEFNDHFNRSPPMWAKNDKDWKNKFTMLANIIADIEKYLSEKKLSMVHSRSLTLSRKIMLLFELMPMNPEKKYLINFSEEFGSLWEAIEADDKKLFGNIVASLSLDVAAFRNMLSSESINVSDTLCCKVAELHRMTDGIPATLTWDLKFAVEVAEDSFKSMNQRLREKSVRDALKAERK